MENRKRLATSYYQLGSVMNSKRNYDEAMNYFKQALDVATQDQFHELRCVTMLAMGQIAEEQYEDLDKAERFYQDAFKICQTHSLMGNLVDVYQHLASVALQRGRVRDAEGYLINGLAAAKTHRDAVTVAFLHRDLGNTRARMNDINRAREFYLKALETFEQIGDDAQARYVYRFLAKLAVQSGDIALAEKWLEKIRAGNENDGLSAYFEVIQFVINDDPLLADRWSRVALKMAERLGSQKSLSIAQQLIGVAAEARGDFRTAIEWYNATIKTRSGFGDQLGVASVRAQLAGALFGRGKLLEGAEVLIEAITVFQSAGQVGLFTNAREQFESAMEGASPKEKKQLMALWKKAGLH